MKSKKIETILTIGKAFESSMFEKVVQQACEENIWFTAQMVGFAVESIKREMLNKTKLKNWLDSYEIDYNNSRRVGVICAGNIPLVGLYDVLCCIACGHSVTLKPSSKDKVLMEYVCKFIDADIDVVDKIDRYDIDMLIATGSDATAESVANQYKGVRSLIRHSRKSVAKLTGLETVQQLQGLNNDIFLYFGLGCRNVSHLFFPKGFDFLRILNYLHPYQNDNYNEKVRFLKAIMIMKNEPFVDGDGFVLLEQHYTQNTPIGAVSYSFYETEVNLNQQIIQCTVGLENLKCNVDFGKTQCPQLLDAPDNNDVIKFLNSK